VSYEAFIRRVCLPQWSFDEVQGKGILVGWGANSNDKKFHSTPNELEIPTVNSSQCFTKFPKLAKLSSVDSFCGGYENKRKGVGEGDDGSGLYFQNPVTRFWEIKGISSANLKTSNGKSDFNAYHTYTNVARFVV
jgi:hypothetical protein